MTVIEALQRSSLFKDFSETGLKIFASIAVEKTVPAGSPIFVENMLGDSLLIVKSGTVRLLQRDGAAERELGTMGAGDHLGELGLLTKSVRLVSAVAATPCAVIEIAQRDFYRLQPQKPQACLKLALAIATDLGRLVDENRGALREMLARSAGA